jgi:hypothetical protein
METFGLPARTVRGLSPAFTAFSTVCRFLAMNGREARPVVVVPLTPFIDGTGPRPVRAFRAFSKRGFMKTEYFRLGGFLRIAALMAAVSLVASPSN